MKSFEIIADEVASAHPNGRFFRFRPGRIKVSNGRIQSVESFSRSKLSSLSRKSLREKVIIPGFVDSHTHLVFAGDRAEDWNRRLKGETYQQIAQSGGGIKKTVRETRTASAALLLKTARERLRSALSMGTTTIEIKSGYGLSLESEFKVLDVIARLKKESGVSIFSTFMGAHAIPAEFSTEKSYIDFLIDRVLPEIKGRADFQDVFCEKAYFSAKESIRLLNAGKKFGLKPKVHAHEFGRTGGVQVAAKVKALSADHLMEVSDSDLKLLKKSGVVPVILPGTSFFLGGKKFAPALKMWRAKLPVAIASDFNPGTNPSFNMPLCGTICAIHQGLNLEQILTAQTLHGAYALGLRDRGAIIKGMRADFVGIDASSFEEIYYSYGGSRVSSVYLAGKKVP